MVSFAGNQGARLTMVPEPLPIRACCSGLVWRLHCLAGE
jgi:hypothetical protein